jgi:WXG100 family type VII secretion target
MSNINVNYDTINGAASQLDQGREALQLQIQQLNTLITNLTNDGFVTTAASGAYQQSFTTYSNGAKQTIDGLIGLADFLRKTAQTLQETDQAIANAAAI